MSETRRAGVLYLVMAVLAIIGMLTVPRAPLAADPAAAAAAVRSSELVVRLGVTSELASAILFVLLGFALYRIFRGIDRELAALMVVFVVLSIPITFVGSAAALAALGLWGRPEFVATLDAASVDALGYVFLRLHSTALVLAQIFWGLWLFPLALLTLRSHFVPRIVGALLILAGLGYVLSSATAILLPAYATTVSIVLTVAETGELAIIAWLLGSRPGAPALARASAA